MNDSLLAALATRLSPQPENLATEALAHILRTSRPAARAFTEYLVRSTGPIDGDLRFDTQVYTPDDSAVPDLVGFDKQSNPVLIVESKFWAGLTENQPNTYLRRLPSDSHSVLVFLCPTKRAASLWSELIRRAGAEHSNLKNAADFSAPPYVVAITAHNSLAVVTWAAAIRVMSEACAEVQEKQTLSDLSQLESLCTKMDTTAFLPLRPEEFSPQFGRRVFQFAQLVNEVTEVLASKNLVSTRSLKTGGSEKHYHRYMQAGEFGFALQFSFRHWAELADTPLWLRVYGEDWEFSQRASDRLAARQHSVPPTLYQSDHRTLVPLFLPTNVEKDAVIASLVSQIAAVIDELKAK